jgi:cytochrome c oxidase subunit 2
MNTQFRFWPDQASTVAPKVDMLYAFLLLVTVFFTVAIFAAIVYLALRYRRRPGVLPQNVETDMRIEIAWTVIPLILCMGMFGWAAKLYVEIETPPSQAMQINVVAKQWMWKIQHPEGAREINTLHVPTGRPIKLTMTSQDVIHSFYVPAFRTKQDVVPGRYTTEWFEPTTPGEYHLFCAEYCGAQHSGMIGSVIVMKPSDYQAWLAGAAANESMSSAGSKLFVQYACNTCHGQRAPTLAGLYGTTVHLQDGSSVVADENYIRESILQSSAKIVAGYPPIMPMFQGQLSEEQVTDLVEYIKSLKTATTQP